MKALALKYRPQTFDDLVEQGAIKQILEEQLATKTHQNCYLFTGGAGTGKTTAARIFANEINERKGNPIEIDAASNNGVDNVRGIIDDAKFKSLDSTYKVYIIDECHMLSTGAWNAMLKLLEEPPAQTIFIMCTTDPQKIPATILSRVQRYDFKRITHNSIVKRLEYILIEENALIWQTTPKELIGETEYHWTTEALDYIAKIADGGMRDAITLLDKCISYSQELMVENVVQALGTADYDTMLDLTNAIIMTKVNNAITIIEEAHRSGVDLKQFMKQFGNFMVEIYKYYLLGDFEYLQIPSTLKERLDSWEEDDFEYVGVLMQEIMKLNADIKWESNPKPLIEATIIILSQED